MNARSAAIGVLALIAVFWIAVIAAGSSNPGYSQSRDFISALASVGADRPWLGVLAIASAGVLFALTAILVRPISRTAAISVCVGGAALVVASFARLRCVEGAAFCGVGDRQSSDLENTRGYIHETATLGATLCIVIAMTALGVALIRHGQRAGGIASLVAAAATVVTLFLATGDSPGTGQRIWVAVMLLWALVIAVWTLTRTSTNDPLPTAAAP